MRWTDDFPRLCHRYGCVKLKKGQRRKMVCLLVDEAFHIRGAIVIVHLGTKLMGVPSEVNI